MNTWEDWLVPMDVQWFALQVRGSAAALCH